MAGFGENLRREREMRGISLEEISDTTKISVRFLEALEREDFGKLPGGIFIRSFIRSYAHYLGLDQDQVLAEFQLVAPSHGEEDFSRLGVTATPGRHRISAPVLPWVVAILLLAGGYAIFRYSHRSAEAALEYGNPPAASKVSRPSPPPAALNGSSPSSASENPTVTPAAPQPAATQGASAPSNGVSAASAAAVSPTQSTPVQTTAANPTAPVAATPSGSLVLQVVATEQSWVDVKADGKTVLERVMNPNDVRTLSANNFFDVATGNAEGTVLTLNGVTLKPLGRRGEVKTVHLTRDDLKNANP